MFAKTLAGTVACSALFFSLVFGGTTATAKVDKTQVAAGDTITYTVSVASTEKDPPVIQLPSLEVFFVLSQAQSSTVTFVAEQEKRFYVYAYVLAPKTSGKMRIGPSQVIVKGASFNTDSFEISVAKDSSGTRLKGQGQTPETMPPEEESPSLSSEQDTGFRDGPGEEPEPFAGFPQVTL